MQTTLTLDAALRDLAGQLRDDIPGMVERGLAQQRLELPEFFVRDDDPDFVEVYRQSYQQQLRFMYDGLESGRNLEGYDVPPLALEGPACRQTSARPAKPERGAVHGWDAAGVVSKPAANGAGPSAGTRVVTFGWRGAWAELRAVDTAELAVVPGSVDLGSASVLPSRCSLLPARAPK